MKKEVQVPKVLIVGCLLAVGLWGCGQSNSLDQGYGVASAPAASFSLGEDSYGGPAGLNRGGEGGRSGKVVTGEMAMVDGNLPLADASVEGDKPEAASAKKDNIQRKIISNLSYSIEVKSLESVPEQINKLVTQHEGYILDSGVHGSEGKHRTGNWTLRIPQEKLDSFTQQLLLLGEVTSLTSSADDITDAYFDIQARLRNKQAEEQRLLEHLQKDTAELKDILEVEREISRVRGEIEVMQGRLRLWDELSALATLRLEIREVDQYRPSVPLNFSSRLTLAFFSSWSGVVSFTQGATLSVIATVPWLVYLGPLGVGGALLVRRMVRKMRFAMKPNTVTS